MTQRKKGARPRGEGTSAGSSSGTPSTSTTPAASTPSDASSSAATLPSTASSPAPVDPWTAYWLAPVAAVRPWLFAKLTLFILAFDLLHTHLGPAWRYGAAGFNVPHFDVLRALPVPTTSAYVGVLFFTSASALVWCVPTESERLSARLA